MIRESDEASRRILDERLRFLATDEKVAICHKEQGFSAVEINAVEANAVST